MGASRIKGSILQAAVHLFGKAGFDKVTTREIAHEANCMEGGIYRLYGGKARLYEEAIATVVQTTNDSLGTFALGLFEETSAAPTTEELVKGAVHRWYESLSQDSARFLQQVLSNAPKYRPHIEEPFANVLAILRAILEGSQIGRSEFDVATRTVALIADLFELKLSYSGPADSECAEVDRRLNDWYLTLPRNDKPRYPFRSTAKLTDQPPQERQ